MPCPVPPALCPLTAPYTHPDLTCCNDLCCLFSSPSNMHENPSPYACYLLRYTSLHQSLQPLHPTSYIIMNITPHFCIGFGLVWAGIYNPAPPPPQTPLLLWQVLLLAFGVLSFKLLDGLELPLASLTMAGHVIYRNTRVR